MITNRKSLKHLHSWMGFFLTLLLLVGAAQAQTTQFLYQGRLTDSSLPANGSYDFQFKLFDALAGGAQVGATFSSNNVSVSSGVFTVTLDFGATAFSGANRWLEINVRTAGGGAFTTLAPRQPVASTPYAVKSLTTAAADSLSASCVGCVGDAQIATVAGTKVTGTIPVAGVPAGSGNYIQNSVSPQSAGFNISGNGTIGGALTVAGALNGSGSALTNLNAANIASGTLPIARGGTGISTAPTTTGQFLRSTGANTWGVGGLAAGDLPGGSSNYIQNSTLLQTGNFNLSGNGFFGGNVGIGTITPTQKLDVSGGIRATNEIFSGLQLAAGDSSPEGGRLRLNNPLKNTAGKTLDWVLFNMTGVYGDALRFWRYNGDGLNAGPSFSLWDNGNVSIGGGSLGIGTDTPADRLHVAGGIRWSNSVLNADGNGGSIELGATNATAGIGTPFIDFHFSGLTQDFNVRLINNQNNVLTLYDSTGRNAALRIGSADTRQSGDTRRITFGDDNCGGPCVYIGEEDADDRLVFNAPERFIFQGAEVIPGSNGGQNLGNPTHRWATVYAANGTIQTSDARMKKSVGNLSYGLSQVMQLRPVSFQWNDRNDNRTYLGLIAQEVEKVIPEAIERDKDPNTALGMNYTSLVPVLIKAVQEQQTTLERKDAEIKALTARLAAIEQMMEQFQRAEKQPKQ